MSNRALKTKDLSRVQTQKLSKLRHKSWPADRFVTNILSTGAPLTHGFNYIALGLVSLDAIRLPSSNERSTTILPTPTRECRLANNGNLYPVTAAKPASPLGYRATPSGPIIASDLDDSPT